MLYERTDFIFILFLVGLALIAVSTAVLWLKFRQTEKLWQEEYNSSSDMAYYREEIEQKMYEIESRLNTIEARMPDPKRLIEDQTRHTIERGIQKNRDLHSTTIIQDLNLGSLLTAYNTSRGDEIFVSLEDLINNLILSEAVSSEDDAKSFINQLVEIYPSAIRLENIRGKLGKQIAIYEKRLRRQE